MTYSTASATRVTALQRRACALGRHRRIVFSGVVVGVATAAAASLIAASVALAAAWMAAASLSANSVIRAKVPLALETVALAKPHGRLPAAADVSGSPRVLIVPGDPQDSAPDAQQTSDPAPTFAPTVDVSLFSPVPLQPANSVPPPPPPPPHPAKLETAPPEPAPKLATVTPPPPAAASGKRLRSEEARNDAISLPDPDSRTAVYDIAAHAVYLPNGGRLEAHSGLGGKLDDPRYVSVKNRGATPPNVYSLVLREQPFHGVRAIRLIPAGGSNMFGRDGILAHSYMLGPSGQSNGCVSFSNYPAFLRAFLRGEVDRLVVVANLATGPGRTARSGRGHTDQYVSNNQ